MVPDDLKLYDVVRSKRTGRLFDVIGLSSERIFMRTVKGTDKKRIGTRLCRKKQFDYFYEKVRRKMSKSINDLIEEFKCQASAILKHPRNLLERAKDELGNAISECKAMTCSSDSLCANCRRKGKIWDDIDEFLKYEEMKE